VTSLLAEAELCEQVVHGGAVREVEIDVRRRIRAVRPELDRKSADDNRAPPDPLYLRVDERDDSKLPLSLVLESQSLR